VLVVEHKRALVEPQLKAILYHLADSERPVIEGKRDRDGAPLLADIASLSTADIALALVGRLPDGPHRAKADAYFAKVRGAQQAVAGMNQINTRKPHFCSGCPHNTSTTLPEGSMAAAGIGCHFMALWMDRSTVGFTAMGGEGAQWVGQAPFSKRGHMFQNLGDGTYNHSGALALRFAVASGVNVTYKILYNDAVAMTGGQPHEGGLSVDMIANQVRAEGVERIAIVTDEPEKYGGAGRFPAGATVHHRENLDAVQRDLREIKGVSVLIYDQTCAAEKRRRRKRGTFPDPDRRVIINELVCEGCGDCGVKSNCVSVQPLETEYGRKRRIDQSSCNKDYSCLKGFCPSFVTVHGGKLRKAPGVGAPPDVTELPEPVLPTIEHTYSMIVTGVGGTGVVTIGAILGMAAHIEGKGIGIIDQQGLAQKGGAVYSHIRFANHPDDIHAIRVAARSADLVLAGDIVVAGSKKVLAAVKPGKTKMVLNLAEFLPGDFTRNADFSLPMERLKRTIANMAGAENCSFVDAARLASALLGNTIGANIFLLGFAYQRGAIPISDVAIEEAITLNGEAVAMNIAAFRWGRHAADDIKSVEATARTAEPVAMRDSLRMSESLDEMIARRVDFLTAYQSRRYAKKYRNAVEAVRAAEAGKVPGETALAEAAARYLFKLMAYKDEYEVARLQTDPSFGEQINTMFEGDYEVRYHLAPPILAKTDPNTGHPRKIEFGQWMLSAFGVLRRFKVLRGTPFEPFGRTEERRTERALIGEYRALLDEIVTKLTPENHHLAVALASIPDKIRGYGHVKMRHLKAAKAEEATLIEQFRTAPSAPPLMQAAE
jgi:indolepyruvate ferredoxin oxidoreductase